jgi:hypothetical protein
LTAEAKTLLAALYRLDPGAWMEVYGRVRLKDPTKDRITLNYLQRLVLAVWVKCQELGIPCRIIILKPRQKGSTTISGGLCYWLMRARRTTACIIGGEYSQTLNAWKIVQNYHSGDAYPNWGNTGSINAKAGKFTNGSELIPETARDREAGRSATIQFLLATELARWSEEGVANASEVLAGILKCVPPLPDTTVILESTAKGATGDFYDRYQGALDAAAFLDGTEAPEPGGFIRIFAPWYEFKDSAFRLTPEKKDEMQRTLDAEEWYAGEADLMRRVAHNDLQSRPQLGRTDHGFDIWEQLAWRRYAIREECQRDLDLFNQDYPESADVAFLRSGRLRFNGFGLKRLKDGIANRRRVDGVLEIQPGGTRPGFRQTSVAKEAAVWIWEQPTPGHRYLIAVDPATGTIDPSGKDPDCHAVLVLRQGYHDATAGWVKPAVVARIAPPCRWEISALAEEVWKLAVYYGGPAGCLIVPEVNMDRGLIELLKLKSAQIVRRTIINKAESKETIDLGFQTTQASRGLALDGLARAIREWDTEGEGIAIWDEHLIEELGTFVIKKNGRAEHEDGKHDDDVLALAIGLAHVNDATRCPDIVAIRAVPADIARRRAADENRRSAYN